ncbi:kinetochore protein SPC24 [Candidatus Pacearchaeota archaeon]|jgi:hypothetical protein|nr:kinetochore protein SPC24 [Candidatus Pacearchaeota archaeon]
MSEEFNFDDLTTIEIPVKYKGESYVLREASEASTCQYENAKAKCVKMADGKFAGIDGPMADTEPLLVSLCLFDSSGANVALTTIRSWPGRLVKKLFDKAKQISELDQQDEETLTKQLEALTKQLDELRKKGNPSKNV